MGEGGGGARGSKRGCWTFSLSLLFAPKGGESLAVARQVGRERASLQISTKFFFKSLKISEDLKKKKFLLKSKLSFYFFPLPQKLPLEKDWTGGAFTKLDRKRKREREREKRIYGFLRQGFPTHRSLRTNTSRR